jgi:environmental stress-induced protein Ves
MRSGEVNSDVASLAQAVVIQQSEMSVSQWAGGSTTQLAIYPPHSSVAAQDFLWRFSSATVEQSGAFTRFPQHQRLLALRQGAGFTFTVEAKLASAAPTTETPVPTQQAEVTSQQQTLRFAGCCASSAKLLNGAITDINLMLAAGYSGNLLALPLSQHWQPLLLARPEHSTLLLWSDEIALNIRVGEQQLQLASGDLCVLPNWPRTSGIELCAPQANAGNTMVVGWVKADVSALE